MVFYQNCFIPNIPIFGVSPSGWPGIVVRELGESISKCVIKNWKSTKIFSKSLSVVNYLQMYNYVINTCCADIAALLNFQTARRLEIMTG